MTAPCPDAAAWTHTRLVSRSLAPIATRSVIFVGKNATEAEIARRLAESKVMTRRLIRRRSSA